MEDPAWFEAVASAVGLLTALLELGGPVALVLLLFSILTVAILLVKLWQFSWSGISSRRFIDRTLNDWRNQRTERALARLENIRNPIARTLEVAIRGCSDPQLGETSVREEVQRVASWHLAHLRRYLRGLELIATLSPLLGLLGTVLGMIEAFQRLEQTGSQVDPALLSGGIWEALVTTAMGLAVAIPAVIILNWLERIVEHFTQRMENAVTQVFTRDVALTHYASSDDDSHAT